MIYGQTIDGRSVRAARGIGAVCPHCRGELIAKCGSLVVHHWAHREGSECEYSRGMTQWHYDWLMRYQGLGDGWQIEHFFDSGLRFDAYNARTRQAIEFQRIIEPEYIEHKIEVCRRAQVELFWLIDPEVFRNFVYTRRFEDAECEVLFSPRRGRRRILAVLEQHKDSNGVRFLIDFTDERRMPRYYADRYQSAAWKAYRECMRGEVHPMACGMYRINGMRFGRDKFFREEMVLEVEAAKRKYGL